MKPNATAALWLCGAGLLAACVTLAPDLAPDRAGAPGPTDTPTMMASATVTPPAPAETLTGTPTRAPTRTRTPAPSRTPRPTRTPKPTPTATATPYPTLEWQAKADYVLKMLATNGGCELPCWWGITPGQTSWAELEAHYQAAGIWLVMEGKEARLHLTDREGENSGFSLLEVRYRRSGSLVQDIRVTLNSYDILGRSEHAALWQGYALDAVLARYGVPDEVYVEPPPLGGCWSPGLRLPFALWVAYQGRGVAVYYSGEVITDNTTWQLCPQLELTGANRLDIHLQAPGAEQPIVDVRNGGVADPLGTLAATTGMSLAEFHETFSDYPPSRCLTMADRDVDVYDQVIGPPAGSKLAPEMEDALLASRLAGSADCDLPCWWGIRPGITPLAEAQQLFLADGKAIVALEGGGPEELALGAEYTVGLYFRGSAYPFGYVVQHRLFARDGIVQLLGVTAYTPSTPRVDRPWVTSGRGGTSRAPLVNAWQRYAPDQILARLGPPSQVLLHYWDFGWLYSVAMVYDDLGILVHYVGPTNTIGATSRGRFVRICPVPGEMTAISLWLRAPGADIPLADVFADYGYVYPDASSFRQTPSFKEATGRSLAEFYEAMSSPAEDVCWDVPSELADTAP